MSRSSWIILFLVGVLSLILVPSHVLITLAAHENLGIHALWDCAP